MGVMNRFMNFLGLQEEEEVVEREVLASQEEPVEATPFDHRKTKRAAISLAFIRRRTLRLY